jgi:formylglycine-generating enzyme required for sulfatase activity
MGQRALAILPCVLALAWHDAPARASEGTDGCGEVPAEMRCIPGGPALRGDDRGEPDQRPAATIEVSAFWLDAHEATNADWRACVEAGACRAEAGPRYRGFSRPRQPIVGVSWFDARAYCQWRGKRLPTEAEWEFAARGGLSGEAYAWGADLQPGGRWVANIFQGEFPHRNRAEDGFSGSAPVSSYPANGYGLYDMAGNVWEWCSDWYRPDAYRETPPGEVAVNPRGPATSFDPSEPGTVKRVQRGGSFLCTDQYCTRYRIGTRGRGEISSGANHTGFRCVQN